MIKLKKNIFLKIFYIKTTVYIVVFSLLAVFVSSENEIEKIFYILTCVWVHM